MLTLKAFGTLDLTNGRGEPVSVALSQPKRAALLAYLAVAHPGGFHTRDALLALFWPESSHVRGRGALSQALSFLRRELGDGVLVTRGTEAVGLDPNGIMSDVQAFEEALEEEAWGAALDAYGGDLLAGLHVAGADPFMDWVDRERERLREAAADAGWRCAHERIAAGELTEAERTAQRAVALVPTDESRVRRFIQALADAGDRAAALRLYEKFRSLLAVELEVEPAPETVAAMERIRQRSETVEPPGAAVPTGVTFLSTDLERRPTAREPSAAAGPPRRHSGIRIAAAAAIGLVLLLSYGIARYGRTGGPGTLIGQGFAEKYDQVVVADLASADTSLGFEAAEWLRVDLDQSNIIRPVSPEDIAAALHRMQRDPTLPVDAATAREIAVRDGYPLVVVGEIEAAGSGYLITVRLEAKGGAEVLGRFRASARRGEGLVEALDGLGTGIRRRIGESLRAIRRSPPLEQVATPSLEALRLYSDAVRLDERLYRPRDAIPLYERAVALDTGFASAYYKLSWTLNELGTQWNRELELSRKAYEHRDRLTDFQAAQAEGHYATLRLTQWADTSSNGPDGCAIADTMLRMTVRYVRRHPEDPRPLLYYGYWQDRLGHDDEAMEAYRKLVALSPSSEGGYNNLALIQMRLRRFEEARKTLDMWRDQVGASPTRLLAEGSLAAREGDYYATESAETAFVTAYGGDASITMDLGNLDAVRGRMREAWAHYDSAISTIEESGDPVGPLHQIAQRALVRLVVRHDTAGALTDVGVAMAAMARAPDTADLSRAWRDVGLVQALARDPGPVRRALEVLGGPGQGRWTSARARLGAALATTQGDPGRALELLASASTPCGLLLGQGGERVDYRLLRILAGRAYEALAEPDSAIAEYEAYFTDPLESYPVSLDAVFAFDTLERLGRLHEARGDRAEAAEDYLRAAGLWKDADPELQPRTRALRERAAALGRVDHRGG